MLTAELVLRTGGGLLAVLGTLWVLVRVVRARHAAGGAPSPQRLRVVARVGVGRRASVVSIDAGDRVLVVGVADGGVRLLAEQPALPAPAPPEQRTALDPAALDPAALDPAALDPALVPADHVLVPTGVGGVPAPRRSAVAGSLVDPAVWRSVVQTAREWSVRR